MRIIKDGNKLIPTTDGESKECGGIETFIPVCSKCYHIAFKSVELTPFLLSQNPNDMIE